MESIKNKQDIHAQYVQFKEENPKTRIRDAAKALGYSEAELVHSHDTNIMLRHDFEALFQAIPKLGYVMALTRNDYAVHERKGVYSKASFHGNIGLITNPDIDLRLFMQDWQYVFAVTENNRDSIQFFNSFGEAIHKIYLTDQSDQDAYYQLLQDFKTSQLPTLAINPKPEVVLPETALDQIDVPGFQQAWLDLQDTHDFFGMLKKYHVNRLQAMQIAPAGYAKLIPTEKVASLLHLVSSLKIDFMVFAGNSNCLQIHTGPADRILRTGPWINVLDDQFNLHLSDASIASLWIVKKPTNLGFVHSVEAFDQEGQLIIQFFGKRKPTIPESEDWKMIIESLNKDV